MRSTYGPLVKAELVVNLTSGESLLGHLETVTDGHLELGRGTQLVNASGPQPPMRGPSVIVPIAQVLYVQVVEKAEQA